MSTSPHRQPLSIPFSMPILIGRISPFGDLKCVKCRLRRPSSKLLRRGSMLLKKIFCEKFLAKQTIGGNIFSLLSSCVSLETWLAKTPKPSPVAPPSAPSGGSAPAPSSGGGSPAQVLKPKKSGSKSSAKNSNSSASKKICCFQTIWRQKIRQEEIKEEIKK